MNNKVMLIGNLGNSPEVKELEGGKKLAKMAMATNETYKNASGERVKETTWHNLIAWGKSAEYAEKYLQKGMQLAVEGKIVNRNYTDKEGVKRYVSEVQVSEMKILDKKE